jgi:NADPH2:quinone reductase
MRAVMVKELGGPEVLELVDLEIPTPGPGEVSIDVAYVGVNFADLKARSAGYRVTSLPFVPGLEVSGTIRAVGSAVRDLQPGQQVIAFTDGACYAEVATAPATTVFPLPDGISLRTGATLPVVLPTAHALVNEVGRLRSGETVLIQGAAGGVGVAAGQLARLAGAGGVYGVVSTKDKAEYALQYGYDEVFTTEDFRADVHRVTDDRGVDLALDPVGGTTFQYSKDSLAPFGRLVSFGNASNAAPWQVGQLDLFPGARTVSGFSVLTLSATHPRVLRDLTERALRPVIEGKVDLPITAEFALEDVAEAHRLMETRTTTGKLLLKVA